jgi:hypothetical protein
MMDKLTPEAVREIVGPITDETVAAIVATAASEADLVSAMSCMQEDDVIGEAEQGFAHGVVERLVTILREIEAEAES